MPGKFLSLATSVSLLCALISGVFFFAKVGTSLSSASNERLTEAMENLYKESLQVRTGDTVTGLQVHSILKAPRTGITYKVTTERNPLGFYYFEDISDVSSTEYISASALFVAYNHFSDEGTWLGTSFVEAGITETTFVADGFGVNLSEEGQQAKIQSIHNQIALLETKINMLNGLSQSIRDQIATVQLSIDNIAGDKATELTQLEDQYETLRTEYNALYHIYYKAMTDIDHEFDIE